MTELSSSQFSSGPAQASGLRARLLEALGAEPEWTVGSEDAPDNVWLAGPVPTFLSVQPGGALTPGLTVLTVRTRCAVVENLDLARRTVDDLNLRTTLSRWVVLGDPGPKDWFDPRPDDRASPDRYPEDGDAEARRRNLISRRPEPDTPVSVELALSFVVGDPSTDIPFEAVLLAVSEQISRATAAVTNNFAQGWGQAAYADLDGRLRSGPQCHPVVHHYARRVAPFASANTAPLLSALQEALEAEQARQHDHSTSAWHGSLDEARFTCEIPYGPGPFEEGVIGMNGPRTVPATDENRTSLVEAHAEDNPQAGRGLLVTMRTPTEHTPGDPSWWQASMLNAQSRLNGAGTSAGMAHGLGAWVVHDDVPEHVLFVPASWVHDLPPETLVLFFRQVLANLARLSWSARRVLEPLADLEIAGLLHPDDIAPGGLAAGPHARGLQFGEPGVGTDAGAEVLAFTWNTLVEPDARWGQLFEGAGFDFWPHHHVQRITTRSCSCADRGSCVTIDTPLLWGPTRQILTTAMRIQAQGWPAALISDGPGLIARTVVHVHDDTLAWARSWPAALAVAQALLAEQVDLERVDLEHADLGHADLGQADLGGHDLEGGNAIPWTSDHPESGRRHDRDQVLALFDPGRQWSTPPAGSLDPEALALAATFCDYAPYALGWHEGCVLMDWSLDIGFQNGSTRTSTVRTTYGRFDHPAIGPCLRISTDLQVHGQDPGTWCLEMNEKLTSELLDTFVLGGLTPSESSGVTYTTVIPAALDQSRTSDLHALFIGTSLSHHVSAVARLLLNLDTVGAPELTQAVLAERYGCLADFYRESGLQIPAGLTTVLTEAGENNGAALTVFRPWSPPGQISEWPRMGAFDHEGEPAGIRTVVPLGTIPLWLASRLAHTAILGAAKVRVNGAALSPPLSTVAFPLGRNDIHAVLGSLVQDEVLCFDVDQGELLVSPGESRIVLTAGNTADQGWGSVLTITAAGPVAGEEELATMLRDVDGGCLQIGDWHRDGDHLQYRVCLPPQAFVTANLAVRRYLFEQAVRSVATQALRLTRC